MTEDYLATTSRGGPPASEVLENVRQSTVATTYEGRSLSRPAFLEYAQIAQLTHDLGLLHRSLTGLPNRLFGGDVAAFARGVGTTETQATAVVRGRGELPPRIGRADFFMDEVGFRLMEINWGSAVGGLDGADLNRAMLAQPFIGDFVQRHGLSYVDPMVELVDTLFTECRVPAGSRPVVALTDWPRSFETLEPQLRRSAEGLGKLGMDAYPCHIGQLRYADGRVWLGDLAVDIVYRLFLMEALLDETGPQLIEPVLRAAERREVAIFAPMDAELYGSKGALALLSDEAYRHLYPPDELASLDRILPWTRLVRPGPVTVDGRMVDLLGYAAAEQAELILKPTLMHGGQGIVAGWRVPTDEWRQHLEAATEQPYVLQRRIHPVAELFPTDTGTEQWTLAWGAIMASRGYGGMFVRGVRDPDETVNMATGATGTCSFHATG
ncbi:MAG: hypothetical protein M3Y42_02060 [Actinomycetota bacterium]|nr:hypothetical protein [Actinomycetota bacterium]MDQ2955731.1 hypothetical protein [Actinomycetota bacterium]